MISTAVYTSYLTLWTFHSFINTEVIITIMISTVTSLFFGILVQRILLQSGTKMNFKGAIDKKEAQDNDQIMLDAVASGMNVDRESFMTALVNDCNQFRDQ